MAPVNHISFHFSIGNSSNGAIGATISICSDTAEHALQHLRDSLCPDIPFVNTLVSRLTTGRAVNFYINPQKIGVDDIVDTVSCRCDAFPMVAKHEL